MSISRVRSVIASDLSDTYNIVPFENTTPINQNKKVKIKERALVEQIDQINRSVIFATGLCSYFPAVNPFPGAITVVIGNSSYCKHLLQALHVCAVTRVVTYAARR